MKNWLKKYVPTQKSIEQSRELKGLLPYLKAPTLWAFDCESVARGVAAGLAGAVIPGFQIFYAAILVIIFRGNLPIALLATLVTNPFTAIPIIYFIHWVGALIIGNGNADFVVQKFHWDFSSLQAFWANLSAWILQFGKSYFVGVPIVSVTLAIIGYFGTIFIWKASVLLFHKKKK
jgi:uncharacterized protein (DUF2062 family)